jgi:hypothetical protein
MCRLQFFVGEPVLYSENAAIEDVVTEQDRRGINSYNKHGGGAPALGIVRAVTSPDLYTVELAAGHAVLTKVPAVRLKIAAGRALDAAKATQGNDWLEHVEERVGRAPGPGKWKDEVPMLILDMLVRKGMFESTDDPSIAEAIMHRSKMVPPTFQLFCEYQKRRISICHQRSGGALSMEQAALAYLCSEEYTTVLTLSVHEARPDYAGITHEFYGLLAGLATHAPAPAPDCYCMAESYGLWRESLEGREEGWAALVNGAVAAARCSGGLSGRPRCITCSGVTIVVPGSPGCLTPEGYQWRDRGGLSHMKHASKEGIIVRFLSAARDAVGLHTAVQLNPMLYVFPPMTLFTAVDVQLGVFEYDGTDALLRECRLMFGGLAPALTARAQGQGQPRVGREELIKWVAENAESATGDGTAITTADVWVLAASVKAELCSEVSGERRNAAASWFERHMLPPGAESTVYNVRQTLVTVRATYHFPHTAAKAAATPPAPPSAVTTAAGAAHDKLTASSAELAYGDRMTYVRGVSEIVFAPPMAMAAEWLRDHQWTDWTGGAFSGKAEWDYVWSQPAVENRGGVGGFDQGHDGWRLERFRQLFVDQVEAAGGGEELVPTLEEVAAARLYTGPAYVKLNGFMRLVGGVPERHWRARIAQVQGFTYSSTVLHLINAIRKITQIAALQHAGAGADNSTVMLYRGVRGKMPAAFHTPDIQGMITAVDFGFQSTSTDRDVPIGFMAPDQLNVLWVMHGSHGADSAGQLHNGAVLQPLSQFPAEAETLLPPLCMLRVLRVDEGEGGGGGDARDARPRPFRIIPDQQGRNKKGETVMYTEIHVQPCFV